MSEVNNKWPQEEISPKLTKEQEPYRKLIENVAKIELATKEKLSNLKSEVWIFEGVEPDMKMCAYTWLKIRFPWKKIKSITSLTSSAWWIINEVKLLDKESVGFDWTTPNLWIDPKWNEVILSFSVENEDWTRMVIERKIKLKYTPYDARGNHEIKKQWNKIKNSWNEEKKITVRKEIKQIIWRWLFLWNTPDTKNKQYENLILQFSILQWKKIKEIISVKSSNWSYINGVKLLDSDKIQFDLLTSNAWWTMLTFKVKLNNWKIVDATSAVTFPNTENEEILNKLK